ncbi:hypothetical protein V2I22_06920 [Campylobacter sp. CLAX-7218-21]|uniref:hypothetical protein n=1 Tax=Campylobacter devanensis TaxID=3161138 RepID=UPI002EB9B981|nr:hypothetical protein [Campylobacter sp. CLAX-7218-21]
MGFFSTIGAAIQQAEQTRQQSTQSSVFSAIAAVMEQVGQESTQSTTTAQVASEENEIKAKRQELLNAMIGYREMMAKTPQSLADRKIELSKKQNSNDDEYITL